jgi:hypothetical protein
MPTATELAEACYKMVSHCGEIEDSTTVYARGILNAANVLMNGCGVESVTECGRTLLYVNVGDSYTPTMTYSDVDGFSVQSWGGWVEELESEKAERDNEVRCGNCSEFTPCHPDGWTLTRCHSCGCNVQDGRPMPEPTDDEDGEEEAADYPDEPPAVSALDFC